MVCRIPMEPALLLRQTQAFSYATSLKRGTIRLFSDDNGSPMGSLEYARPL